MAQAASCPDAEPLAKYQYEALPSPRSIRLLEITSHLPGSAKFIGKLHTTDLEQTDHLQYLALSYTWQLPEIADDDLTRPVAPAIILDDQTLGIGFNLYDFLEQKLALPEEPSEPKDPHLMWIDAVCINQYDKAERSSQVAFMRRIYQLAAGVVIWLGRHDVHSRAAMSLIASFAKYGGSYLETDTDGFNPRPLTEAKCMKDGILQPISEADWDNIRLFCSRGWFRRLWTVQEVVVADAAVILCGDTWLDWYDMALLLATASKNGWAVTVCHMQYAKTSIHDSAFGGDIALAMGALNSVRFEPIPDRDGIGYLLDHLFGCKNYDSFVAAKFAWTLQLGRFRKASDQKDKVFGPLGMASDYSKPSSWHPLTLDYTESVESVFTRTTQYCLRNLGSLSFLSCVGISTDKAYDGLPSWVPDFSQLLRPTQLLTQGNYDASRGIETARPCDQNNRETPTFTIDGLKIIISGVKAAALHVISGDCEKIILHYKLSTLIKFVAQGPVVYHNDESRGECLMKTLVAGSSTIWLQNKHTTSFEDLQDPFRHFLKYWLCFEIWLWNSAESHANRNWWDDQKELENFLDQEALLPSRSEVEDLYDVFTTYFPSSQDFKVKPVIDDPDFVNILWRPHIPYSILLRLPLAARSMFISEEDYVGLAPKSAQKGDEVWIVRGSRTPFLLRKQSEGTYKFIGEVYIHGLMHGELFEKNHELAVQDIVLE